MWAVLQTLLPLRSDRDGCGVQRDEAHAVFITPLKVMCRRERSSSAGPCSPQPPQGLPAAAVGSRA
ncbi:Unconventional Myosin-Xix [Manis pentadactyla]|nr:Unconventional Myosin-Xix [Manis pentadactyla]